MMDPKLLRALDLSGWKKALETTRLTTLDFAPLEEARRQLDQIGRVTAGLDLGLSKNIFAHLDGLRESIAAATAPLDQVRMALQQSRPSPEMLNQVGDALRLGDQFLTISSAIPEGTLAQLTGDLTSALKGFSFPEMPKIDPAILEGWNPSLLDAYDRLQQHASEIAADPDADAEDVERLVGDVDEITSTTPEETKCQLNGYLVALALWLLDKVAEDPAKAAIHEMLARLMLVLSLLVNPTPPPLPIPVPLAIPAPEVSATGAFVIPGGWKVEGLPDIIRRAGPAAQKRTIEFFAVTIRNPNTRQAYANAIMRFFNWCDDRNLELGDITPFAVAAYVEEMQREFSARP